MNNRYFAKHKLKIFFKYKSRTYITRCRCGNPRVTMSRGEPLYATFVGGSHPSREPPRDHVTRGTPHARLRCPKKSACRCRGCTCFFRPLRFPRLASSAPGGNPQRSPVRVGEPLWRRKARQPPNPLSPPEPSRDHVTRGTLRPLRSNRRNDLRGG